MDKVRMRLVTAIGTMMVSVLLMVMLSGCGNSGSSSGDKSAAPADADKSHSRPQPGLSTPPTHYGARPGGLPYK